MIAPLLRAAALALGLAAATMAAPSAAQELTSAQRTAAEARIGAFDALLTTGRMGDGVDFLPPPLLQAIATRYGVTVEQAREAARSGISASLAEVTIESGSHDFSRAQTKITPDGRRTYLLVPMAMVMRTGDLRAAATSHTLMFEDGGQWWMLSVEPGPITDMLTEVYPEFSGVDYPEDTFEILD